MGIIESQEKHLQLLHLIIGKTGENLKIQACKQRMFRALRSFKKNV